MVNKQVLSTVLVVLFTLMSYAQEGVLEGVILDRDSKETLIGVNVLADEGRGTTTDLDGKFTLALEPGSYTVTFSYVGYETYERAVDITANETTSIRINMELESIEFDEVVVSGSRYNKRVSEEVISIEVIKPDLIDNTVSLRLDDVIKRVTGVNVADGQASIRAGSGWSYSIGSRVNVVLDGQSLLTPDRGGVKWQYLPIESVGQIEVLKGASSILYGSSAMNGTIHLQTKRPSRTAENKFVTYVGMLDGYENEAYNWWKHTRVTSGGYFTRSHKVSDHFEYVLGVNANYTQQHIYEYKDYHARANLHTKWISKKDDKSNYGFKLNYTYFFESEFVFWEGPEELALFPIEALDYDYHTFNIDPYWTKYGKRDIKHHLQGRLYYYNPEGGRMGGFLNAEYQISKRWDKGWSVISGAQQEALIHQDDGFTPEFNYGLRWAIYAQVEKKWDRLAITGGLRSEIFKLRDELGAAYAIASENAQGVDNGIPIPLMRFGLNYQAGKNTFIRFNIGQAFRLPSLAESYVEYEFNSIGILANPDLKPEYGWTSEIGVKQGWGSKSGKYSGNMDLAIFWQEYKDLIEFQPRLSGIVALVPQNLPTARIAGYELTLKQVVQTKHHRIGIDFGYTYAFPVELSGVAGVEYRNVGTYIKDLFRFAGRVKNTPNEIQREALLKYRNRHLINLIVEYENDHLFLGVYGRYYSIIENGDFEFDSDLFSFIPGIVDYWEDKYPEGDFVVDLTAGFKINEQHSISLTIKNIGNREYSLRLAKVEPPRSFNWKYQFTF